MAKIDIENEAIATIIKSAIFFSDYAILGYLLICISVALLTIASIEEVLKGTENIILRTKYNDLAKRHLFAETIFMVIALVQVMHIIGPITGGFINSSVGMSQTCLSMGYIGTGCLILYLVFAMVVQCTIHEENTLNLNLHDDEDNIRAMTFDHTKNGQHNENQRDTVQ